MATIFKIRRDTASNWSTNNPTLASGEMGLDQTNNFIKMGDGSTAWNGLGQFTQNIENVEDLVGAMVTSNTETFISVTYDDSDGSLDFVVPVLDEDNLASDSATNLATQQSIKAYVDATAEALDTAQDLDFQGDSGGALSIDLDAEVLDIAGGTGIDTVGASNTLTVAIDSTVATLTGSQTLTNKSLTSPAITGNITGAAFLDEDNLASNSATKVASQQSIKAYVDASVTAQDLDFIADSGGALSIDLDSESLTIAGGTGIDTVGSGNGVTASIDSTVATLTGAQTLTNKTLTTPIVASLRQASGTNLLTMPAATDTLVGKATTDTLTNKTLTNPVINTGVTGSGVKDEDNMASNSATHLSTQQSIKAYVDAQVTAQDLDFSADSGGALSIDLDSEAITFTGGTGITTVGNANDVSIGIDATVTTLTGSQTLTNKTLTSPVLATGLSGSAFLDEDGMDSNSATKVASQQSIKAYVDAQVDTEDTLAELDDTTITSAADGSMLLYDTGNSVWIDNIMSGDATLIDTGAITLATVNSNVGSFGTTTAIPVITVNAKGLITAASTASITTALTVGADSGTNDAVALASDVLDFTGGTGIDTTVSDNDISIAIDGTVATLTGTQTLTNKTLTTPTITSATLNTGVSGSAVKDEDNMASNSATHLATQQSIKAYVDTTVTAQDLDIAGDSGTGAIDLDSETLTIAGTTNEVETSMSGNTLTVGLPTNVTIAGNLTVSGTQTTVSSTTVNVADPLLHLATNNGAADAVDIGLYGLYDTSGSQDLYGGIFRDASDSGKWKLYKDSQAEPTTTVNVSATGHATGTLVANLEGNVTGDVVGNLTGNVTGNTSGTALTVTQAAQGAITSVGTLTTLQVDNLNLNGNTISTTGGTDLLIGPVAGQQIVLDGAIIIDAGVVTGATSITSTAFVGDLTGSVTGASSLNLLKTGGAMTGAITTNSTFDGVDIATRDGVLTSTTATANAALPKAGGAMTGAITTNSTFDGVDIAVRDAILTSTTTTAGAALPKAGGAMTGAITTNSTFDTRDVATDGTKLDTIETNADVTDATNVNAAGALMLSDTTTAGLGIVVDEDNMASNLATKVPTQQSVKAYVDGQTTDETAEGSSNLYYTAERFDDRLNAMFIAGTNLTATYNDAAGTYRLDATTGEGSGYDLSNNDTDDVTEGTGNLYFTNARADARITNALKDEDNMASNSATHIPTQQSVKAYVDAQIGAENTLAEDNDVNITSAADGSLLLYDTGTSTWIDNVMSGDATLADTGVFTLATVNSNVGQAGSATAIPIVTVNAKGLVTAVSTASIVTQLTVGADSGTNDAVALASDVLDFSGGTGIATTVSNNDVSIAIDATVATLTGSQTLTNKTLTSPVFNTGVSGTAVKDEDNMASNSATHLSTQQSIKAYVDGQTTDETAEGSTNLYHTTARARGAISVTDAGGDGALAYNSGTGVITYTGPSASEVRAHLSAGTGITYSGGAISIGQAVATSSDVQFADLTLSGDLTVNGTTTTVASTNTTHTDALIEYATGTTGTPANDAGIVIERGDQNNAFIGYDESADKFTVGTGTFTGASTGNLSITKGTLVADIEGDLTGSVTGAASLNLLKTGGAMTGAITTNSTFDGVDIATRDAILTSTTTTANAALPKAGGAMTGAITTNSTFDGRDVAADGATADAALPKAGGAMTGAITTNSLIDGRNLYQDGSKLDAIEASADVTDATNVEAAGAVMESGNTASARIPSGTTAQRDGSPSVGFFRWNTTETQAEIYDGSAWSLVGGGNTTEEPLWEHESVVSSNYVMTDGNNAISAGPIIINSGYSVTVGSGCTWAIV